MRNCCQDCKERKVGCHSECAVYLTAKAEHDEEKKRRREAEEGIRYDALKKARWCRAWNSTNERERRQ